MSGTILAVASHPVHAFTKPLRAAIRLLPGLGVAGDAHCGTTVRHRSRRAVTPDAPNLRQVHLLQAELLEGMRAAGFAATPGMMGENVTTCGMDLLALPRGARLLLGDDAVVEVTGLRNPCRQIDDHIGSGAMAATLGRARDGSLIRKAGVMAVVVAGGEVRAGDPIALAFLPPDPQLLAPV